MTDIRQTKEYANYLKVIGWKIEKIGTSFVYSKKIPLLGSVVKIQRTTNLKYKDIQKFCRERKIFQCIVEPVDEKLTQELIENKFQKTKSTYLPSATVILDLTKNKKIIYQNCKKDTRYALRKTKNLEVKEETDASKFHDMWKKSVPRIRYVMSKKEIKNLQEIFQKNFKMIIYENKNELAGAIFVKTNDTAYYWQAFTNQMARKSLVQYKIVWEGILWAKNPPVGGGAKYFDFEGIEDERIPRKSWSGFSHFKKSFGGSVVYFPGTFVKTKIFRI